MTMVTEVRPQTELEIPPLPVVGEEEYHIPVTQRHIDEGVCGRPRQCAVSLAINEFFGGVVAAGTNFHGAFIVEKKGTRYQALHYYEHGSEDWIRDFDGDREWVKPTIITLKRGEKPW